MPGAEPIALILGPDEPRRGAVRRWVARVGYAPHAAESAEGARRELDGAHPGLVLAARGALDRPARALFDELASQPMPVTGALGVAPGDGAGREPSPDLTRLGRLVGHSPPMQRVYEQLLRVAPTPSTVFLVGESGTGKELAAELVHRLSPRAAGPFVPVNCGALSPQLVESELFGHERGSFTGAERRRPGLFERAQGGTILLDEITEMPPALQVKLLRVLESGEVRRVGGDAPIRVDARVVAATNRDPEEAVARGLLRADLLHRLLVFPVELPPLRRRREDVPLLAEHHLELLNRERGAGKTLGPGALERLQGDEWPGNVRQLRNALERGFILADEVIDARYLPSPRPEAPARAQGEDVGVRVGMTLREAERRLVEATLARQRGDKRRTARALGISPKTLYTRLATYRAAAEAAQAERARPR